MEQAPKHSGAFRFLFIVAAFWNVVGTGALFLFFPIIFGFLGIPTVNPMFIQLAFGYEVIFGLSYFLVVTDLYTNSDIIFVGVFAKALFAGLTIYYFLMGSLSLFLVPVGVADLIFAILFVPAYFHTIEQPLIYPYPGYGTQLTGTRTGASKNRVLIIYFTLTKQTERAVEAIQKSLLNRNCDVKIAKIEPAEKLEFPFKKSPLELPSITLKVILRRTIALKPIPIDAKERFDLVLFAISTWWVSPCLPVSSFLADESNSAYFRDRNVALLIVCRALWKRTMRMVCGPLRKYGAHLTDALILQHQGEEPYRFLSMLRYLWFGRNIKMPFLGKTFTYGLSDEGIAEAGKFGEKLAKLLGP